MSKKKKRAEELARREGFLTKEQSAARAKELEKLQDERIASEVEMIRQRTRKTGPSAWTDSEEQTRPSEDK